MNIRWTTFWMVSLALALAGCGGDDTADQERFQLERTPEMAAAQSIRGTVASLNDTFRSEGLAALKSEMGWALEDFEANPDANVGEAHQATYNELKQKLQEFKTYVDGSPTQQEVQTRLQEMAELADKLPKAAAVAAPAT